MRPITLGGDAVALLCVRDEEPEDELITTAAGLISADIARRQAEVAGRQVHLGQVLDDLIRGVLPDREAARRLAAVGVDPERELRVLVGEVETEPRRLRSFPWNLHAVLAGLEEPFVRAVIGSRVVMLVTTRQAVPTVARSLLNHLSTLGSGARVGIGGSYAGIPGLRLSYFEAVDAGWGRPGVHEATELDLGRLLVVADLGLPLRELAERLLRPLLEHDAHRSANLIETLRTWFDNDCTPGPVAELLFIHPNTVRYRLTLVEKITGADLSSFSVRMHYWFALRCLSIPRDTGISTPRSPGT